MKKLIVVAGPAGGGKTTLARKLASQTPNSQMVSTDDFMSVPWDQVRYAVQRELDAIPDGRTVILEGVRALSSVHHLNLVPDKVYWSDRAEKPGTKNMTSRQVDLLTKMGISPVKVKE